MRAVPDAGWYVTERGRHFDRLVLRPAPRLWQRALYDSYIAHCARELRRKP